MTPRPSVIHTYLTLIYFTCHLNWFISAQVYRNCTAPGKAAITFDDGPHPTRTVQVLDVLKTNNVKATFFVNGLNNFESNETRYRETIQRIFDEGHQIGSHVWTHTNLRRRSAAGMRAELAKLADYIFDIIKMDMSVFRPPFGSYNDSIVKLALDEFGYDTVLWNVDTRDWFHKENTTQSMKAWIDTVQKHNGTAGSYIGLEHDPMSGNTNLAQLTIDFLKSENITITTVADCIGKPMYFNTNLGFTRSGIRL